MRKIKFQTDAGVIEIEAAEALVEKVAMRNGITPAAVSDKMILRFFHDASDTALGRAVAEYLALDGTDT